MTEIKNIPELRFPEFNEKWDKDLFGDIASFSKGKGISKADIMEDGEIECIRYGELYTIYNEVIDEVKSKTNIPVGDLILSERNDVIIPASGETQIDIARASCVVRAGVALGGDLNIIKTKLNGIYLAYYLNNAKKKEIAGLAQGISVVHLYSSQLKTLNINYPKPEEQTKIATFLTAIDKRITILSNQKDQLELYKKGLLQKIFNKELRFKDDDGEKFPDWVEKKIKDVFFVTRGYVLAVKELKQQISAEYIYPVYSSQTTNNGLMGFYNKSLYENAITWTTDGANAGEVKYREGKFYCTNVCGVLISEDGNANKCIAELLNGVTKKYVSYVGNPKLMNNIMSEIKINFPGLKEQHRIASFINIIDEQIEQAKYQIDESVKFKKGLSQKLFV